MSHGEFLNVLKFTNKLLSDSNHSYNIICGFILIFAFVIVLLNSNCNANILTVKSIGLHFNNVNVSDYFTDSSPTETNLLLNLNSFYFIRKCGN